MRKFLDYSHSPLKTKECPKCGETVVRGQPDPCLGILPEVAHACCGHGNIEEAYACGWPGCLPNESWNDGQHAGSWHLWMEGAIEFFEKALNEVLNG